MPTYEYHCSQCNASHEISQKITADPLVVCPHCGKPTLIRGPGGGLGLHFQGSGFYITDYGPRKVDPEAKSESKPSSCKEKKASGSGGCPCDKSA